jgi:hypothetical protein
MWGGREGRTIAHICRSCLHDDSDEEDDDDDDNNDDDYMPDVLMGFLGEDMPQSVLPLMINFEAKSITTKFDLLKANMQSRSLTN